MKKRTKGRGHATGEMILSLAQVKYPSWVRGGDWYDVSPPVRLIHKETGELVGIHLLNPVAGEAILVGEDDVASLDNFLIAEDQGPITPEEVTPELLHTLGQFLNIVADERMPASDGSGEVQTPNAVAARTLLNMFYVQREKGLSLPSILQPNRNQ